MSKRRSGRGRLSSIDLLPEEAEADVAWAMQELRERKRTQVEIHAEFNERLAEHGIEPVSLSAFNRHALRVAALARRLEATKEITATLSERLGAAETDETTIVLAEMIKSVIFEVLGEAGEAGLSPKAAMEAARALQAVVAAQKTSAKRRAEVEREARKEAVQRIEKVASEAGLSAERIAQLRRDFLGVRPRQEASDAAG